MRGRVQGVGFRWFVRDRARALNLAGWVRNQPDGSVEVAAEGDEQSLDRLRHELEVGPDGAAVDSVDLLEPISDDLPRPFSILR